MEVPKMKDAKIEDPQYSIWNLAIPYVYSSAERATLSMVCKLWYNIEAGTRKHATVSLCYTTTLQKLSLRFPKLESLEVKGKSETAIYDEIYTEWGGYATPWVRDGVDICPKMKALHFTRMNVSDEDLEVLANSRTDLEVLKLEHCYGFSTKGLFHIARKCRKLRTLFMEQSKIIEGGEDWLHELALNNSVLESLNFYRTNLGLVKPESLELIASRCKSLVSMKISQCDISQLVQFFRVASSLEEFDGGYLNSAADEQLGVAFPPRLRRLGLANLRRGELAIVYPVASQLRELNLHYSGQLGTKGHCELLQQCPNLECLWVRDIIGDTGLKVLSQHCKKIKKLTIVRKPTEDEMADVEGTVTQNCLVDLSQGCLEMIFLLVNVTDVAMSNEEGTQTGLVSLAQNCDKLENLTLIIPCITNSTLESIGRYSRNLREFWLILDDGERMKGLNIDDGIRSLLQGCHQLTHLNLSLQPGVLTDVGLSYIGEYSPRVRSIVLDNLVVSNQGILDFSKGCPSLEFLAIHRGCSFNVKTLALATRLLTSLKCLWVYGYNGAREEDMEGLSAMARPHWVHEWIRCRSGWQIYLENGDHILAYISHGEARSDQPVNVTVQTEVFAYSPSVDSPKEFGPP